MLNMTEKQGEHYGKSHNYAFRDAVSCLWLAGQGETNADYWEKESRAFTLDGCDYLEKFRSFPNGGMK